MKKIVSIALFGDGSKYKKYLPSYVRSHLNIFPIGEGWKLRVHYDDKILSSKTGDFLRALNWDGLIEIDYRGTAPLCRSMMWRLAPVFDDNVSHVFCRDLDAVQCHATEPCVDSSSHPKRRWGPVTITSSTSASWVDSATSGHPRSE